MLGTGPRRNTTGYARMIQEPHESRAGDAEGDGPQRSCPMHPIVTDSSETPRTLPKTDSVKHFDLRTRLERAMPEISASLTTARLPAKNSRRRLNFPLCTRVRRPDIVASRPEATDDARKPPSFLSLVLPQPMIARRACDR